jgi:NTP pyrophosphatase (non-canonical NTP hydrolase)
MSTEDAKAWREAGKNPRYRPLTLSQKLGYLAEECGEMLAALGKTIRWGTNSTNPELGGTYSMETNAEWMLRELKDLDLSIGIVRRALRETLDEDMHEPAKAEPSESKEALYRAALEKIQDALSPKNRQAFVMLGPRAIIGVANIVEEALK